LDSAHFFGLAAMLPPNGCAQNASFVGCLSPKSIGVFRSDAWFRAAATEGVVIALAVL